MNTKESVIAKTLSGAGFLQRIVELNLNDPRSPERIVYPLYVIATIVLLARLAGFEDSRKADPVLEQEPKGASVLHVWTWRRNCI